MLNSNEWTLDKKLELCENLGKILDIDSMKIFEIIKDKRADIIFKNPDIITDDIKKKQKINLIKEIRNGFNVLCLEKENKIYINNPKSAKDFVSANFASLMNQEHFFIISLNTKYEVIGVDITSLGTKNCSIIDTSIVFKKAIQRDAYTIMAVHNHPSGNTKPSKDDIEVTKRLSSAGKILNIKLLDHLIIGDDVFSFKQNQIMLEGGGIDEFVAEKIINSACEQIGNYNVLQAYETSNVDYEIDM